MVCNTPTNCNFYRLRQCSFLGICKVSFIYFICPAQPSCPQWLYLSSLYDITRPDLACSAPRARGLLFHSYRLQLRRRTLVISYSSPLPWYPTFWTSVVAWNFSRKGVCMFVRETVFRRKGNGCTTFPIFRCLAALRTPCPRLIDWGISEAATGLVL